MTQKVNYRKAQGWACPACGGMLEWLFRLDSKGKRHRCTQTVRTKRPLAKDDAYVERTEPVSRYESKVVGHEYVHTVCFACPTCNHLLSESQAVRHEFAPDELPADYYVDDMDPDVVGLMAEVLREGGSWEDVRAVYDQHVDGKRVRAPQQQRLDAVMGGDAA